MAGEGITYSRLVALLKVVLPLSALALLSTLFLISQNIGGTSSNAIPFAKVDLEQRAREQQITAPFFSGKTSGGHLVSFTADQAKPDPEDALNSLATKMDAEIDLLDGSHLAFTSDLARVNNQTHTATLSGNVIILSSNGYTLHTDELSANMRELSAETLGAVAGEGPAGRFEAGKMMISPTDNPNEVTLFFTQGVKLIYIPMD
ncbi:lipopolysaccharide export system protein LptC [Shimia gijangensis]|uniref:Lipopolysaccharide export system protein LptC n=1 Tax=Shimia gijangensis TaxID=1470563 RepID=A0A1M6QJ08_9RHOB|nr:LPS export ABC transporter periplasmic protein LptC [Shimia gijangensis]SHK20158.1 lipopolysaccharide export system protein LptC [Shimia gijangensis]